MTEHQQVASWHEAEGLAGDRAWLLCREDGMILGQVNKMARGVWMAEYGIKYAKFIDEESAKRWCMMESER